MWVFSWLAWVNFFSQTSHTCSLTSLWVIRCLYSVDEWRNDLPHSWNNECSCSHKFGTCVPYVGHSAFVNHKTYWLNEPRTGQTWGLAALCIRTCSARTEGNLKAAPHSPHLYGRSPEANSHKTEITQNHKRHKVLFREWLYKLKGVPTFMASVCHSAEMPDKNAGIYVMP